MTPSSHTLRPRGFVGAARIAAVTAVAALGALAGCASNPDKRPPQLSNEQVCVGHFDRDPVERDRCHQTAEQRRAGTTELDPHQLPVDTDQRH